MFSKKKICNKKGILEDYEETVQNSKTLSTYDRVSFSCVSQIMLNT